MVQIRRPNIIGLRTFFLYLWQDIRRVGQTFWHDRSLQVVTFLSVLPWAITIAIHRDPNVWIPLAEILGIIVVYWFFTRGQPLAFLPVRRPLLETALAVGFVVVWILYRIAEYGKLVVFPPVSLGVCQDLTDTIIPKTLEMTLVPLLLFLLLRYSLPQLGLGFPIRAWIPAILPILAYLGWGLTHQQINPLATRTGCFYFGAGLPEEFLFRALLLSRVEALIRRPSWAVLISAALFGASHIPIDLHGANLNWQSALENAFTFQMGVGLAMGFAFQRCRNIWPLTIIHALIDAAP